MFFLYTSSNTIKFRTKSQLIQYIEDRHAEEGGVEWINEIRDNKGALYGCNWKVCVDLI
jgi:hypothetical protein